MLRSPAIAGKYELIVSRDLWAQVQDVVDGRNRTNPSPVRRDFAFSNLIKCGHCGCAMAGELKKQRYVYYHIAGSCEDERYRAMFAAGRPHGNFNVLAEGG
jgi:hypothetical protein